MPGIDSHNITRAESQHALFDDSLLIKLARMEVFPLPSTTYPWIVGISIVIWLLVGYLILEDVRLEVVEVVFILALASGIFAMSWSIAMAREDKSKRAFGFVNKCRRQMMHFACYLGKALFDLDKNTEELFRRRGYALSVEKGRDYFVLAQIKIALDERSANIKRLLLSGSRKDLQNALFLLKAPFVVHQRVAAAPRMAIPLENLSAMVLTLLEGVEMELDDELYRDGSRVDDAVPIKSVC